MAITERSRKSLWGRAAGRCSYPDCNLVLVPLDPVSGDAANVGHEAHIVAESEDGPRGDSPLTKQERDDYSNLVLMCRHHHGVIDEPVLRAQYPVERLHEFKSSHEQWVEEHLAAPNRVVEAAERVYTKLIDSAVENCGFGNWRAWTSEALSVRPKWRHSRIESILSFRDEIVAAVFYGANVELEAALTRLGHVLAGAALAFEMQSDEATSGEWLIADQFYRNKQFYTFSDPQEALMKLYDEWQSDCYERVYDATSAANWLCDIVRRDFNPMFFALEGRFTLLEIIGMDRVTRSCEYDAEQRLLFTANPRADFDYALPLDDKFRAIREQEQMLKSKARER